MDRTERANLAAHVLMPGQAHAEECVKLSANRFIPLSIWKNLKFYEQNFLRAYAVTASSRKAAAVGLAAARIHGLWTPPNSPPLVELANPAGKPPPRRQWPVGVQYRRLNIPPIDLLPFTTNNQRDSLILTTPERTVVDVARFHGIRAGVLAIDSLLSGKPVQEQDQVLERIGAVIARLHGHTGISLARQALEWSSRYSESPYESIYRVACRERGILLQEQMWIGPDARVDFLHERVVVEIHGLGKLQEDPTQAAIALTQRENWISEQNYEVLHLFTPEIRLNEELCIQRLIDAKVRSQSNPPLRVEPSRFRPKYGPSWRPGKQR